MKSEIKIAIHTGGIPLFLFLGIILLFLFALIMTIPHIPKNVTIFVPGCILYTWVILYVINYLMSNNIILTEQDLNFSIVSRELNHRLFPISVKSSIPLDNIRGILLGKPKQLKIYLKEHKQDIDFKSNIDINRYLLKLTSVIQIIPKNGEHLFIDTKPFTKRDILNLLKYLQTIEIPIIDLNNTIK
jgi:hypothetical protein